MMSNGWHRACSVVVVVNGTTDDTAEVAAAAGATVLHADPGYGTALLAGYRHALSSPDTAWVIQMDADGQHPAAAIPRLRAALADHDVVIGSRFAPGGGAEAWPRRRRWTIAALGVATRVLKDALFAMYRADIRRSLVRLWSASRLSFPRS